MKKRPEGPEADLQARLRRLGLHGLLTQWSEVADEPWLSRLLDIEEKERKRRSLLVRSAPEYLVVR